MHSTASMAGPTSTSLSLVETITDLRSRFTNMKDELQVAHCEIARLRNQLDSWNSLLQAMPELDLASLRRQTAFHCHPDRGGNAAVMCRLNTLFDFIENAGTFLFNQTAGATK